MCNLNMCVECFIIVQHLIFRILVIPRNVLWQTVTTHLGLYILLRLKPSSRTEMHSNISIRNSKLKCVWSGNTTITNRRQTHDYARKSHYTITRHQEDKISKAASSLFPIKMIAILEWTYSNVQQNIEQLQTPTMGVTINKKLTTTEPPP